jgi:hypothetical protein
MNDLRITLLERWPNEIIRHSVPTPITERALDVLWLDQRLLNSLTPGYILRYPEPQGQSPQDYTDNTKELNTL